MNLEMECSNATTHKRGCEKEMETLGLVVAIYLCKFIF